MNERPNLVILMTDTQTRRMVSCYGEPLARTPRIDGLAASGIRFDQGYTACPLCTPARGALFTGLYPSSNGAWANNVAPGQDVAPMGEMFARLGYRTAYTGKWHLDGGGYFGDGEPGGGFEPDWWYDGFRYAEDIGPEAFTAYKRGNDQAVAEHGLDREENLWGYRVASRACDFLGSVADDEPFLLVASFDEPHGPYRCPPGYYEDREHFELTPPVGIGHVPDPEPEMHRLQREESGVSERSWERTLQDRKRLWDCNRWVDTQIGRVLDAIDVRFADNTVIVYTSDHGEQQAEHGLMTKGPMMYQESVNVPFVVRTPDGPSGATCSKLISHLDIIPTFLDLAGAEVPPILQGVSQVKTLRNPAQASRDSVRLEFTRFAVNHDGLGGLYPIRTWIADDWKLVIHLDDAVDQLFHLATDPAEMENRIDDPSVAEIRDRLHDALLEDLNRTRDPWRGPRWANRPWRDLGWKLRPLSGDRRDKPAGFSWQTQPLEAQG